MSSTAKQQLSRNPQNAGYANPIKTYPVPAMENEDGTISVPAQPVYGIDPNHEPIDLYLATRTIPGGVERQYTATTGIGAAGWNITCPAGKKWVLRAFVSDTTATATVGNRRILVRPINLAGAVLWVGSAMAALTAAQIGGYDVGFGAPINTPSTTVRRQINTVAADTNVQVRESCPTLMLNAGDYVQIRDSAAVDAADSVFYVLSVTEYDA